jgi:deoxyribodipyrimidine photo-lyase
MRSTTVIASERVRRLNSDPARSGGSYILYWMQSSQRAEDNHALEFAVQRANQAGLPLVALFVCTPDYPEANLRHYTFMLEGLFETLEALSQRGILPLLQPGHPPDRVLEFTDAAAEVVVDRGYFRHLRNWYEQVARGCSCSMWQVESDLVVPVELASTKAEYAARTIRPRIKRHLDDFLVSLRSTELAQSSRGLALTPFQPRRQTVSEFLRDFQIDRQVGPVSQFFRGGQLGAKASFREFLADWLKDYDIQRNQPQTDYTSTMSPYLHFGQISPLYLATTMLAQVDPRDTNVESYLEELLIRRGLSINFVHFEENYDSYRCLPGWAASTLSHHAEDARPDLYSREQFEAAQTHDPYWNAAQVEMVETGYMHNYMKNVLGEEDTGVECQSGGSLRNHPLS